MFCKNCGKQLPDHAQFCNHCGTPIRANNNPVSNGYGSYSNPNAFPGNSSGAGQPGNPSFQNRNFGAGQPAGSSYQNMNSGTGQPAGSSYQNMNSGTGQSSSPSFQNGNQNLNQGMNQNIQQYANSPASSGKTVNLPLILGICIAAVILITCGITGYILLSPGSEDQAAPRTETIQSTRRPNSPSMSGSDVDAPSGLSGDNIINYDDDIDYGQLGDGEEESEEDSPDEDPDEDTEEAPDEEEGYPDEETEEEDEEEGEDDTDDRYAYHPNEALILYTQFFVDAVNSGSYDGAEFCMQKGSQIYRQQKAVSESLYRRNIRESLNWCNVKKIRYITSDKVDITSDEGVTVTYADGTTKLIKQSYIYTCIQEDDIWLLTNMREK